MELEARYHDLELRLIEAAAASFAEANKSSTLPTISAETALKLLALRGGASARNDHVSPADPEALRQTLRERIDIIRRNRQHPPAPPPAAPIA